MLTPLPPDPKTLADSQRAIAKQTALLREARRRLDRDEFDLAGSLFERALRIDTGIPSPEEKASGAHVSVDPLRSVA